MRVWRTPWRVTVHGRLPTLAGVTARVEVSRYGMCREHQVRGESAHRLCAWLNGETHAGRATLLALPNGYMALSRG